MQQTGSRKMRVLVTTGMIYDPVKTILGEKALVEVLFAPGVDPHLYKATQGDLARFIEADLIIYNGLHLEGKMTEIFEELKHSKSVYAFAEALPESMYRAAVGDSTAYDPHVWMSVKIWAACTKAFSKWIQEKDPTNAAYYQQNTEKLIQSLDSLDAQVRQLIQTIPPEKRILVTAHDAFAYFGQSYGLEIRALQGISTASDIGLQDVISLTDFLTQRKITAIFAETSVSSRSLLAVIEGCKAKGHSVCLGPSLFSDALGNSGSPEGTYVGMILYNTQTIVKQLTNSKPEC
jgi:manganese/zinc/iron transport system substrate-binding protein